MSAAREFIQSIAMPLVTDETPKKMATLTRDECEAAYMSPADRIGCSAEGIRQKLDFEKRFPGKSTPDSVNEIIRTMPAFGVDRNIAIHQRLHQTGIVADYCGDDAECFRLLVKLANHANISRINLFKFGNLYVEIYFNGTASSSYTKERDERAFRNAITCAAWEALTSAQAGKP